MIEVGGGVWVERIGRSANLSGLDYAFAAQNLLLHLEGSAHAAGSHPIDRDKHAIEDLFGLGQVTRRRGVPDLNEFAWGTRPGHRALRAARISSIR